MFYIGDKKFKQVTIGDLKVNDCFRFSEDELPHKILSMEEMGNDIFLVDCKATKNFYKYDRYQRFKGRLHKGLKVYIDDEE